MIALGFDTETTGLMRNQTMKQDKLPEIIEFYGCLFDLNTGLVTEQFETLVKPQYRYKQEEIEKITSITDKMLEQAPTFKAVAPRIAALIEQAPLVIAHNLAYDKEIIDIEMARCARKVQWPRGFCTVEQTMHLKGFRLSLQDLHNHLFNGAFVGAHRAAIDVEAMCRCCVELHKRGEL